jgi:integrase
MTRSGTSIPSYRFHKRSGQAIVTLSGRMFYLGPYDSAESRERYNEVVAQWLAQGRRWLASASLATPEPPYTVVQLIYDYWQFVTQYYVKHGRPTSEQVCIRSALRGLRHAFGRVEAKDFTALRLQELREHWIQRGLARTTINQHVMRVRRMFRWAVSQEKVPPSTYQSLLSVSGLKLGRSAAREPLRIRAVSAEIVAATLPFLPPVVRDMVQLQMLTGCRPGELVEIRPCDVDRTGAVWVYRPASHKTEHHGIPREICIGPRAQEILRPYLLRAPESFCFSPQQSELIRRESLHARRRTPLNQGNRSGGNRRVSPLRPFGEAYSRDSYRRSIDRACQAARVPVWRPNQLRHLTATTIRKEFGLEAAQVVLGHTAANVTQVYAERDQSLAVRIAAERG